MSRRDLLLLSALLWAGCASKSSVDFSAFHGVYLAGSHTWNPTSCDSEGSAVSGADALMVLYSSAYRNCAVACACVDLADCRDQAATDGARPMTSSDFAADFQQISADRRQLTGTSFGVERDTLVAHVTENVLAKSGESIRIEMRSHVVPCQTHEGECDRPATIAIAAGAPCSEFRVVNATFAEPL